MFLYLKNARRGGGGALFDLTNERNGRVCRQIKKKIKKNVYLRAGTHNKKIKKK